MALVYSLLLGGLESIFLTVILLILYGLRHQIGKTPFYICVGGLFIFTQIVSSIDLSIVAGFDGFSFHIANTVLCTPLLVSIMIIYISEGTLAMQRLIIGLAITFGVYIYIGYLTSLQCNLDNGRVSYDLTSHVFIFFVSSTLRNIPGPIIALLLNLFAIPIAFQKLRNLNVRLVFAIFGSLFLSTLIYTCVDDGIFYIGRAYQIDHIMMVYSVRFIVIVIISFFLSIYLSRIEKDIPVKEKGSLDILFAFLGSYGMTKALKRDITEWEGRYRTVVESTSDIIIVADSDGLILDANPSAQKLLKVSKLNGELFSDFIKDPSSLPEVWKKINDNSIEFETSDYNCFVNKELELITGNNEKIKVDASFTKTFMHNNPVVIIVCRDISEQYRLKKEKEDLMTQLYHSQRLDSIGKLAGGVAHEFNNMLHAIQGHIDLVLTFGKIKDSGDLKHLEEVNGVVDRASSLTSQLLGFARKTQSVDTEVDLREVLGNALDMFEPITRKSINVYKSFPEHPCNVKADKIQLQQVILNILINAMDAMKSVERDEKSIKIILRTAFVFTTDISIMNPNLNPDDYFEISIEDNGIGMTEEVRKRIFEPFFTTKDIGDGTGMGLSMAYGEINGYAGFIDVQSAFNKGSVFYIYLPQFKP